MASDPQNPYLRFQPPSENPYARFKAPSLLDRAKDFGTQGFRQLGEAGYATAQGVARLAGYLPGVDTEDEFGALERSREEMREFYGDPEGGAGMVGGVAGRVLGEGALLAAGGGLTRGAAAGAGKIASRAGAGRAGAAVMKATAPAASRYGRFAQDVAFGAPGDVAISAAGPEDSAAGGLAAVLDNETLERIAENPAGRALFEVGTGALGAGAIHGLGAAGAAAGRAIDPTEAAEAGIREFGRQAAGTYGGDFTPAREVRKGLGVGAMVKGPGGGRYRVESIDGDEATIVHPHTHDTRRTPVSKAEADMVEPVDVPVTETRLRGPDREGPPFPATPEGAVEEGAQAVSARPEPEPLVPGTGRPGRLPPVERDPLETPAFERRTAEPRPDPFEKLSDDQLRRRYLNRIRTATVEEVRASGGGRNAAGRLSQSTEATDALAAEMRRRGIPEPHPDEAFRGARPEDFPPTMRNDVESVQRELGDLGQMEAGALGAALREAEDVAARSTEMRPHIRRALLAGEAAARRAGPQRPGFASRELAGAAAGATAGGAIGAAVDDESRGRGAAFGAALGTGAGGAVAGLGRAARSAAEALDARYLDDPTIRSVAETVGAGESRSRSLWREEGKLEAAKGFARWLRFKGVRDVLPLERFGKIVGKSTRLRNTLAQARGWLPQATLHAEKVLAPIRKAVQDAGGEKTVGAYLRAERGLQLARAGKETTGEQLAQWQETVGKLRGDKQVTEAARQVSEYYRELLRMKRDAGVITPEQFEGAIAEGDFYIPFLPERVAQNLMGGGGGGGRGKYAPNTRTGVRKMTDELNQAQIVDPFEQAVLDTYETFQRVAKQRVANVIADIVEQSPDASMPFIRKLERRPERAGMTEGRVVEALVNGERQFYEVLDEDLFASWASFDQRLRSGLLNVMRGTKRLMQEGVTGHPSFALANGIRDFFVSGVQYPIGRGVTRTAAELGAGAGAGAAINEDDRLRGAVAGAGIVGGLRGAKHWAKHVQRNVAAMTDLIGPEVTTAAFGAIGGGLAGQEQGDGGFLDWLAGATMGGLVGAAGGRGLRAAGLRGNRAAAEAFTRGGGGNFGFYARDRRDAARLLKRMERDGVKASDILNPRSWWDAIQYVSKAIETAPRLARYKELLASGAEESEAIFHARDLSLDFAVKPGSRGIQALTETTAFLNPAIQGMDKLVRLLKNPNTTAVAASTIVAPTLALWALNSEDQAYWDRPLYERNTYWLVPKRLTGGPEGEFWRVPKPFEVGFIYSSLPERMLDYAHMRDPEALKVSLQDAYGQYGPGSILPVPTAILPGAETMIGEHGFDTFRQRTVNPYPWKNVDPSQQFDERTGSLAIGLSKLTGGRISPAKIDHVLIGHTGSVGAQINDWISAAARGAGIDDRPEPIGSGVGPFARFSTKPESLTEPERQFRRRWDRAERAYNTAKELHERGNMDAFTRYVQRHRDELGAYTGLKETNQSLNEVWKARREILKSKTLSPKEKRTLMGQINRVIAVGLQAVGSGTAEAAGTR